MFVYVVVSGCPASFFYLSELNLCYHVATINLRWQAASQYCRAADSRAHLVIINDQDEQDLIAEGLQIVACKYTNQNNDIFKTGVACNSPLWLSILTEPSEVVNGYSY